MGVMELQRRNVTILGYGAEGAAHALCLRDSGVDVRIGLPEGDPDWAEAEAEGFVVKELLEAAEEADLLVLVVPGPEQEGIYEAALADSMVMGDALIVTDGFALRHGLIEPPAGVDVGLVTTVGGAEALRREYVEGRGVPVVIAVAADPSGTAWDLARSYAAALGGERAGIITSTVAEVVDAAALGRAAVADAGIPALMQLAFRTLVDAGYDPQVAYLACVHEAARSMEDIMRRGLAAHVGSLPAWPNAVAAAFDTDLHPADATRELLTRIQDGGIARDLAVPAREVDGELESAGAHLRDMMPWLRHGNDIDGRRWR